MQKLYTRINWENHPSDKTPVNEQNLNKVDAAVDEIDNRVIQQDTVKLSKSDAMGDLVDWSVNEETGIITVTRRNGEKILFDLNVEKIPVSFYLSDDGILTMVTDDGTTFTANIGAMIPVLTFQDSDTIAVSSSGSGVNKTYSFSIKTGTITEDMLRPDYLADIKVEAAKTEVSATLADASANEADYNAKLAQSYAVGTNGEIRENDAEDNAKKYKEQAQAAYENLQKSNVTGVKGSNETEYRHGNVNITPESIGAVKTENPILPGGVDLNTVVNSGFYRLSASPVNGAGIDNGAWGELIVSCGADTIMQILSTHISSDTYVRTGALHRLIGVPRPDDWNPWQLLLSEGNYANSIDPNEIGALPLSGGTMETDATVRFKGNSENSTCILLTNEGNTKGSLTIYPDRISVTKFGNECILLRNGIHSIAGPLKLIGDLGVEAGKDDVNTSAVLTEAKILNTKEQIDANTDASYVAGALAVKEISSNLGKEISVYAEIAATSNTYSDLCHLQIPAGSKWIFLAQTSFTENSYGVRSATIVFNQEGVYDGAWDTAIQTTSNGPCIIQDVKIIQNTLSVPANVYLKAMQSSGATLDCSAFLQGIRIL